MRSLASPTIPSWNQIAEWLRDMDGLRESVPLHVCENRSTFPTGSESPESANPLDECGPDVTE